MKSRILVALMLTLSTLGSCVGLSEAKVPQLAPSATYTLLQLGYPGGKTDYGYVNGGYDKDTVVGAVVRDGDPSDQSDAAYWLKGNFKSIEDSDEISTSMSVVNSYGHGVGGHRVHDTGEYNLFVYNYPIISTDQTGYNFIPKLPPRASDLPMRGIREPQAGGEDSAFKIN